MNKKVLILSSSPRKGGNSDILCDEFIRGAKDAGNTTERLFIKDYKINYCNGCSTCDTTHKCVQQDDMADILDKMVNADVIVMGTPVYFYSMSAQLKTLIDRTAPRYKEIADKDFYFILAAADDDPDKLKRTVEGFRGFTEDCLPNPHEKGIIYGVGAYKIGDIKGTPFMDQAYKMGNGI